MGAYRIFEPTPIPSILALYQHGSGTGTGIAHLVTSYSNIESIKRPVFHMLLYPHGLYVVHHGLHLA